MKTIKRSIVIALMAFAAIQSMAMATDKEGSGSGGSGGSYHELDISKMLPTEIMIEKALHYTALDKENDFEIHRRYRLSNDGSPWEYFVRTRVKIPNHRDLFRGAQFERKHQVYGRFAPGEPWERVLFRLPEKIEREKFLAPLWTASDYLLQRVVFKYANQVEEKLSLKDFIDRLNALQEVLYGQLELVEPETYGNYESFLTLVRLLQEDSKLMSLIGEFKSSSEIFSKQVAQHESLLLGEVESLNEGNTAASFRVFLNGFDLWATKVAAFKIGSVQWIQEFELKSQKKMNLKMRADLERARAALDRSLGQMALRAERVRRSLATQLNANETSGSPVNGKKHLQIEK